MHIPHKATLSIKTTNKTAFNILSKETKVRIVNKTKKPKFKILMFLGKPYNPVASQKISLISPVLTERSGCTGSSEVTHKHTHVILYLIRGHTD